MTLKEFFKNISKQTHAEGIPTEADRHNQFNILGIRTNIRRNFMHSFLSLGSNHRK